MRGQTHKHIINYVHLVQYVNHRMLLIGLCVDKNNEKNCFLVNNGQQSLMFFPNIRCQYNFMLNESEKAITVMHVNVLTTLYQGVISALWINNQLTCLSSDILNSIQCAILCTSSEIFFRSKSCKSFTIPLHVSGYMYVPINTNDCDNEPLIEPHAQPTVEPTFSIVEIPNAVEDTDQPEAGEANIII